MSSAPQTHDTAGAGEAVLSVSSDLPKYLQPQLRLFLTADIVGSTSYKQNVEHFSEVDPQSSGEANRKKNLHPKWFAPIADFYSQAQKTLNEEWEDIRNQVQNDSGEDIGKAPSFWKAIGDEIGFSKRLTSEICLLACMRAWMSTLTHIRAMLKDHNHGLDVKAAAWVAGFPVLNTEIIFSNQPPETTKENTDADDDYVYGTLVLLKKYYAEGDGKASLTRDFVGPSIDTGFRIAGKATPRKMTVSVELAYILASALGKIDHTGGKPIHSHLSKIPFGYEGRESLKGVMGGTPYPLFWIDMDTTDIKKKALNNTEDKLLGHVKVELEELVKFGAEFIDSHAKYLCKPYILNSDGKSMFGDYPQHHVDQAKKLRAITDWFEQEIKKIEAENKIANPDLLTKGNSLASGTQITLTQ